MRFHTLLVVGLPLAAACLRPSDPQPPPPTVLLSAADSAAHLYWSTQSVFERRARVVVRTPEEWQKTWAQVAAVYATPPAAPAVDFTREIVLVATAGYFSGGGPTIRIDSAMTTGWKVVVFVRSGVCHGPSGGVNSIVQPIDVVRLPTRIAHIDFVETETSFPGCLDKR